MKEIIKQQLALIEDRFLLLDNMVMLSDRDETYILEYEYLRGKRDVLLYLLSIWEDDDDQWDEDYPCDIINEF